MGYLTTSCFYGKVAWCDILYIMQPIDITGQRYNRLTAVRLAVPERQRGKGRIWECHCDCGNISYVSVAGLNAGRNQSCGCLPSEERLARTHPLFPERFWDKIQRTAKRRNKPFKITAQQAADKWEAQRGMCALTGTPLSLPKLSTDVRHPNFSASLDRIDSTIGYVEGNIQWVHKQVNMMKQNLDEDEFYMWCKQVVAHRENPMEGW